MALEIIGMYATIAGGTENAIAQIDVPQDGVMRGIDWDMNVNMDADNEDIQIEFSFIATNVLTTNDVRGRISSVGAHLAVLTAVGGHVVSVQKWIGPFELMLSAGERMYLHSVSDVGVVGQVRLNIHFDGGAQVTRRSARR